MDRSEFAFVTPQTDKGQSGTPDSKSDNPGGSASTSAPPQTDKGQSDTTDSKSDNRGVSASTSGRPANSDEPDTRLGFSSEAKVLFTYIRCCPVCLGGMLICMENVVRMEDSHSRGRGFEPSPGRPCSPKDVGRACTWSSSTEPTITCVGQSPMRMITSMSTLLSHA